MCVVLKQAPERLDKKVEEDIARGHKQIASCLPGASVDLEEVTLVDLLVAPWTWN